jgi:hypothetical protein
MVVVFIHIDNLRCAMFEDWHWWKEDNCHREIRLVFGLAKTCYELRK